VEIAGNVAKQSPATPSQTEVFMGTLLKAANPSPATPLVSRLPNAARAKGAARLDFAGFKSE
jgi:hypothetical protein